MNLIEAIEKQEYLGKVHIDSFEDNDIITINTEHSQYYFKVGKELSVTSNNPKYQGPYKGSLIGTTVAPGASMISPRCFAIGGCMEIAVEVSENKSKLITTSAVKSISVNGVQILPLNKGMLA